MNIVLNKMKEQDIGLSTQECYCCLYLSALTFVNVYHLYLSLIFSIVLLSQFLLMSCQLYISLVPNIF